MWSSLPYLFVGNNIVISKTNFKRCFKNRKHYKCLSTCKFNSINVYSHKFKKEAIEMLFFEKRDDKALCLLLALLLTTSSRFFLIFLTHISITLITSGAECFFLIRQTVICLKDHLSNYFIMLLQTHNYINNMIFDYIIKRLHLTNITSYADTSSTFTYQVIGSPYRNKGVFVLCFK